MRKFKLFAAMVLLAGVIAAVVVFASPYAPVVDSCRDIEEIWALEDTRTESETPLVTLLENNGVPLAYDAQENIFYCTLGLGQGEQWPQMHMTIPNAKGVQVVWVDDYSFDWCEDAIREGYPYQIFAYTDDEFFYSDVIFTGLPLVQITTKQEVTREYTPVHATVSVWGEADGIGNTALAHLRGGASLLWHNKKGYKIKFTRGEGGASTQDVTLPALGQTDEMILLPMPFDETMMRDKLSWEVFSRVMPPEESFAARENTYVEVLVDGSYEGVYLMMEPYDLDEELARIRPEAPTTDAVYRTAAIEFAEGRLLKQDALRVQTGYELYYEPQTGHEFEQLEDYLDLWMEEDDEVFAQKAAQRLDIDSVLRFTLLLQGICMTDSVHNNMYIWAHHTDSGEVRYRFMPWDMDATWGIDSGLEDNRWITYPIGDRILRLDVENARSRFLAMWEEMHEKVFNVDTIRGILEGYTLELENSGAFARNADRWDTGVASADSYSIQGYCMMRYDRLDAAIRRIAQGDVEFLTGLDYLDTTLNIKFDGETLE